jgi:hypothetical protein
MPFRPQKTAIAASVLAVVGWASVASAQQTQLPAAPNEGVYTNGMSNWISAKAIRDGQGIRVGDFDLHPGIGAQIGVDTNYLMRTDKTGFINSDPIVAPVMRITPSFFMMTAPAEGKPGGNSETPKVGIQLGAALSYNEFFGVLGPPKLPGDQRNVGANVFGRVDFLPGRPFAVGVNALFSRTINPNPSGNPDNRFDRNDVGGGIDFTVQPGSGTLDWKLGYQVRFAAFDQSAAVPFNNLQNEIFTKGRWKFRPRTAFVYDATFRFTNYTAVNTALTSLYDSTPLRTRIGITGLVTNRFGLLAMVGWGSSFFNTGGLPQTAANVPPPQFNSVIGQAEAKFYLGANPEAGEVATTGSVSTLAFGYMRDFQGSFLSNYYGWDRGYMRFQWFLGGGKFVLSLDGGAGAAQYGPVIAMNTQILPGFTTVKPDATLFAEYRILPTFGINLTGRYTGEYPVANYPAGGIPQGGMGGNYNIQYTRFEALAGARLFW